MQSNVLSLEQRRERLRRGLRWLRESGIQEVRGDDAGGVYAWIDADSGAPSYVYSEITGYFVTLCVQIRRNLEKLGLSAEESADDWLARGAAAARWIVEVAQHPSGAILSRKYARDTEPPDPWSFSGGRVAYFDCAMVGYGLTLLHEVTGERRWLDAADRIGQYLLACHESRDGQSRYAAFDVLSGQPVPEGERWSQHFGPFEFKSACFLDSLALATGKSAYRELLERTLQVALGGQEASGRFVTHPERKSTHLHPHSYTIEGLLYMAAATGRRDLLAPACRGIDWMFRTCLVGERPLQQWSEEPARCIAGTRSDALSQALRAYEIVKSLDPSQAWDWEPQVPALYERLRSHQTPEGATSYGEDETGVKRQHRNSWCHFFRMEAELFAVLRQGDVLGLGREFAIT